MIYLDANIFIRFLTRDDERKFQACSKIFTNVESKKIKAKVIEAVISEIVYVLISKKIGYGFNRNEICENLTSIISLENLVVENKSLYLNSLSLFETTKLDFEDCVLLSNLKLQDKLYSYDQELFYFNSALVIKPD